MENSIKKTDKLNINPILKADNLSASYDTVEALKNVYFQVNKNEIVAMIGPNGAGKSTALKVIFGLINPKNGEIVFNGENITGFHTDVLVKKGISMVPEGRRLFPNMSVLENLELGAYIKPDKKIIKEGIERIYGLFPVLKKKASQKASTLSTGEQQMIAIGRALMLKPKLLLADEPSLGLSPAFVDLVFEKLIEINKNGTSILLVEQNASMALEIAHRGYVFKIGEIFLEDQGKRLLENEEVKKAFLGG